MTLTLDELIAAARTARDSSPLGGETVVALSEPEVEYRDAEFVTLEANDDGAVFLVGVRTRIDREAG